MDDKLQNPATLTPDDLGRYSRHILLPEVGVEGQARLKAARVLIIGTGGLGSPVGLYLAAAGIGTLGLVEFDTVDRSNLQRQILYADADVGRPKIETAAARLQALSPGLSIERFPSPLGVENVAAIFQGFDVVVDGTDNFATRYLVNDACVLLGKPNIYGSIFRFDGQASVFDAQHGPCYRCLFPAPPPADQVPNCAQGGVLGVLPGLIGTVQATETLKHILGIGTSLRGRLLLVDALTMHFQEFKIAKDPACPTCGSTPQISNMDDLMSLHKVQAKTQCAARSPVGTPAANMSPQDLFAWRNSGKPHVLIDVRNGNELAICRIAGSLHIPLADLASRRHEFGETPIVLHCKSGTRSIQAQEILRNLGIADTYSLEGGILAWAQLIEPGLATY